MRVQVQPPSLRHQPTSRWQRILFWLMAPAPMDSAPPLDRLPAVRAEFAACLKGTRGVAAITLTGRIERARSLRDLWHLRAEIFDCVARQHSQAEAEARVSSLNRHFLTRSPRSGFAPMQP